MPCLADLGEPVGQPVREPDRHRHEVVGLVAGVAEHHALVAGADLVVGSPVPARCSIALSTPIAMSGDCSSIDDDDAAGLAVDAERRRRCSRCSQIVSRARRGMSM